MTSYPIWLVKGTVCGREIYRAFLTEEQANEYAEIVGGEGHPSLIVEETTQYVG